MNGRMGHESDWVSPTVHIDDDDISKFDLLLRDERDTDLLRLTLDKEMDGSRMRKPSVDRLREITSRTFLMTPERGYTVTLYWGHRDSGWYSTCVQKIGLTLLKYLRGYDLFFS